jgi:hypothetical protein
VACEAMPAALVVICLHLALVANTSRQMQLTRSMGKRREVLGSTSALPKQRQCCPFQVHRPVEWPFLWLCLNTILSLRPLATIRERWLSMTRSCFGYFGTTFTSRFQTS